MAEDEDFEPDLQVEYFRLNDGRLARVWSHVGARKRADGEVLGKGGRWQELPAAEILAEGERISYEEASEHARFAGGMT
jgi:hypothetical protein